MPPILAMAGLPAPMPVQSFGMGIGGNPNLSRQSRRLYIGSITPDINEQNLADFFNSKMKEMNIGIVSTGNPVLAVQCNYEKNYAFVEVGFTPLLWALALNDCFVSSAAQKMLLPQWRSTASSSSTVPSKSVAQRTTADRKQWRRACMFLVSCLQTFRIPPIRSSWEVCPPT